MKNRKIDLSIFNHFKTHELNTLHQTMIRGGGGAWVDLANGDRAKLSYFYTDDPNAEAHLEYDKHGRATLCVPISDPSTL